MKINPKIFAGVTTEPFQIQEIDGKILELHYMNDTPFLHQFAAKARFAVWTSDGGPRYKILLEKRYYEMLEPFYQSDVNAIWLDFLENAGKVQKKLNLLFLIPSGVLYLLAVVLGLIFFREQLLYILIFMLLLVFVSNTIQSRVVNKKVSDLNVNAQTKIRDFLGEEEFARMVDLQQQHYNEYYQLDKLDEEGNFVDDLNQDDSETKEMLEYEEPSESIVEENDKVIDAVIEEVVEVEEAKESSNEEDLNTKTVAELRELAKEKGLTGYSKFTKKELIEELKK